MYLKRVELAGFKSFADRTEFEFVPGITAVVGPNGSGKSNITDAIRWVLGEQSAKSLRGAKMEDIIFAGSDSRKPVNFSEVSLTLDNGDNSLNIDYTEVTITRRLFRSGESEYFINNQSCRLKDITELLMDTGLGKEAYSIIGQGKIEEILSSKPEDRRGIFEEAAGIVKYKTRKREAQRKLEETEQNLIRISDLISELEVQVEPLSKQAETAKLYKDYAEKLKKMNIQIYLHDIEQTYNEWQETEANKKNFENEQLELSSRVSQIDASIEKKRWNSNQLEKELEDLHKELVQISERVEQAEGKKEVLKEREKNHQENRSQTIDSIDKLLIKKSELLNQLEYQKDILQEIENKVRNHREKLIQEEENINKIIIDHNMQIEIYKGEYFEILNSIATLRNEIRHIDNTKESISHRIDKVKFELEQLSDEKNSLSNQKQTIQTELANVRQNLIGLENSYNENLLNEKKLIETQNLLQFEIKQQQQKLNSLISRQEVLTEMQADFSGFQEGVKEILKLRDAKKINGIHGAIAELIVVPKEYETAIEVALGGSLQYIVVDKESIGREAIAILKEKKSGRATFLPLDVIRGRAISKFDLDKIASIEGFIGIATDLINIDLKYKQISEFLLGQVVVTKDLKAANQIAKLLGYTKRIVTIEGDVVNPGGSMTGGSLQKRNVGLLGRQREIDELTAEINKQKQLLNNKQSELEKIEIDIHKTRDKIEQNRSAGEHNRLKGQELQGKLGQMEAEEKNTNNRQDYLNQEAEQLNNELQQAIDREKGLNKELLAIQSLENELQTKIAHAELLRKQDETTKQIAGQKITEFKIELARLEQERDGNRLLVERLTNEQNEIINNIEQYQKNLIRLENDLETQEKDRETISQEIGKLRLEKDLLTKNVEEKRLLRLKLIQEIETEEIGSKEIRKNLKAVESEYHNYEVKLNRLDVELENLLKQLADEYEMSYEWAKQFIDRTENIETTKREVRLLKNKIQELGEVNLGAIEEYARVAERYNFLTSQKVDLVEAKETLYQVIEEVDEEMTKRFKESFDAIREQFQLVFSKLFGGGRADLILTDDNNLLETGVEIVAQPPGKKLQNLALLSGGEKALTAITLLFAILRVKPVPFCVLDEVEAALDEANVARFTEYLREFCEYTQFIVVTHRKGTMEGADVLYGVTMQESGVSRLVSVKLEEKEKLVQMA